MKKSTKIKYEWLLYAKAYLKLAEIGYEELIDRKYNTGNIRDIQNYKSKYLLIPIIFNIKHSLELFIKAIGVGFDQSYIEKHDINYLLSNLEKRIIISKCDKKIEEKIKYIKPIIEKYFYCEFLKLVKNKKIKIKDFENELFRYPETKELTSINIIKEIENFKKPEEKDEILIDINRIGNLFSGLDMYLTLSEDKIKVK